METLSSTSTKMEDDSESTKSTPSTPEQIRALPLVLPSKLWLGENEMWLKDMLVELGYKVGETKNDSEGKKRQSYCHSMHNEKKYKLIVNPKAKDFFQNIKEPFGVITISGPLRGGKS